ncbi:5-hydroxytryptamine receptor 4-like [Asterias amurensis]|uniref:5-hydroxytryptamine receptor 4-like n=1 Tax=Asterias amurensis TaxID=7602 RepID=UPI003AB809C6
MRSSTTNIFLASLAVADLSVAFLCIPIDVTLALGVVGDVSPLVCLIGSQLTSVSFAVSANHLVVVAYDRFLAISRPLHYPGHMTTIRVRFLIFASWSVAILLSLVPFFGWNSLGTYDLGYCDLLFIHPFSYRCTAVVFLAFVPFTMMGYFYWRIFKVAREQRRRIREQTQVLHLSKRKLGLELKAAKTVGLIMGIFILEYTPASLVSCADVVFTVEELAVFKLFSFHLLYSNSAVNPMMYAFRSKEFRGGFVKLLRTVFPCGTKRDQ